MTPDEHERRAASQIVARQAREWANRYAAIDDAKMATIAILIRAIEQLTPGWSPASRARLFTGDDE